jgi:hypothetical protein
VERFAFDARWKFAAGGLDFDYHHTDTKRHGKHSRSTLHLPHKARSTPPA